MKASVWLNSGFRRNVSLEFQDMFHTPQMGITAHRRNEMPSITADMVAQVKLSRAETETCRLTYAPGINRGYYYLLHSYHCALRCPLSPPTRVYLPCLLLVHRRYHIYVICTSPNSQLVHGYHIGSRSHGVIPVVGNAFSGSANESSRSDLHISDLMNGKVKIGTFFLLLFGRTSGAG
jgi:hypothetical protein